MILVLRKPGSHRAPYLSCRGAESPGWFDVLPKNSARDVMHERVHCHDEAANHQLPIAVAFWIIWTVSVEECSSLTQNLMQIRCSTWPFWVWWPHSTHAHSLVSPAPTDWYSEVTTVHTCAFRSTLLVCQVTSMSQNCSFYIDSSWTFSGQTLYV